MSNPSMFEFGKLVPGFEFLQNLAKGAASGAGLPKLGQWIAPTLSVEELEKRIEELKTVQFWLDQNAKALAATVQALEVQKMTLATLKGMNFSVSELAQNLSLKTTPKTSTTPASTGETSKTGKSKKPRSRAASAATATAATTSPASASAAVDPMQWWGALTQQFQTIATQAMKDAARQGAMQVGKQMAGQVASQVAGQMAEKMAGTVAGGLAQKAVKTAGSAAKAATQLAGSAVQLAVARPKRRK